tara:strand:- start:1857 stop:2171 length:315 start_codon:yes stop_codon:yes gene_type:complete
MNITVFDEDTYKIRSKFLTITLNQEIIITEQFLKLKSILKNIEEEKRVYQIHIKQKELSNLQKEIKNTDLLRAPASEFITIRHNITKSQSYINEIEELILEYKI